MAVVTEHGKAWRKLRLRLTQGQGRRGTSVIVTPEELITYFTHWDRDLYSGDPIRVQTTKTKILVRVGDDVFEVARKPQRFFLVQSEWDRFLQRRCW